MALRVLLLLLSLTILANLVILLVSWICDVNMYKKYGNIILKGFGVFILFIVAVYVILALLGLS